MGRRTVEHLLADVRFALNQGMGPRDLVPMLTQLVGRAAAGSEVSRFARLQLALQLLESHPFRAATLARSVTLEVDDDEAFGLLGLALTVLGHYRAAATAHRRACRLHPSHPGHAHNFGHLLDEAFGLPKLALPWLRRAFLAAPDVSEIASSYAHALVRVGQVVQARAILQDHAGLDQVRTEATVNEWLCPPNRSRNTG